MEEVYVVRHRHLVEGVPIRQIAREMGIDRNTVRRYVRGAPAGVGKPRGVLGAPVRDAVQTRVIEILEEVPERAAHARGQIRDVPGPHLIRARGDELARERSRCRTSRRRRSTRYTEGSDATKIDMSASLGTSWCGDSPTNSGAVASSTILASSSEVSAFAGDEGRPIGTRAPPLDGASIETSNLAGAVTACTGGHCLLDELEDHLSLPSSVSSSSAACSQVGELWSGGSNVFRVWKPGASSDAGGSYLPAVLVSSEAGLIRRSLRGGQ